MHYERFRDHDYLGAWDFEDGERVVTIDRVEQGLIDRQRPGEKAERVPLMYLRELDRPMVLNSTNGMMIRMLYGTSDTRAWAGKPIALTTGLTTDKQGHPCLGIRVSPKRPELPSTPATEAERIASLEAELAAAKARTAAAPPPPPAELPAPSGTAVPVTVDVTLSEVSNARVA